MRTLLALICGFAMGYRSGKEIADVIDAARHWFSRTLAFRESRQGICGYRVWRNAQDPNQRWRHSRGLVEGVTGIGLALMAAATPLEPAWDQCMCVNLSAM